MSKYRQQNQNQLKTKVRFCDFWLTVADEIGSHRFDVNPSARSYSEFFNDKNVHADYIKEVVRSSLPNQRGKLDQTIDLTQLLDTLGETAYTLRQNSADDLFDIELLEEIGWVIASRYYPHIEASLTQTATSEHEYKITASSKGKKIDSGKADIYSLTNYKTRLANKRL